MASEEVRKKYSIDELIRQLPDDRAEFFQGYAPWPEELENWTRSSRDRLPDVAERQLIRTIAEGSGERESRLLIDVVECHSAADALEALADNLAANQLERLEQGPASLGPAAFVHPEAAPPAVFFVRGNLSIMVASFGRKPVPVIPIATRLVQRLGERPSGDQRPFSLALAAPRGRVREENALDYKLPARGVEDAYVKFFATGGTVLRKNQRLFVRPARPGRLEIEAFFVESGREPHSAKVVIEVEETERL